MFAVKLQELELINLKKPQIQEENVLKTIPLDHIYPNPNQPRKLFNTEEIYSLSRSIREFGLIQPITVRSIGEGYYELIAGERRYRACRLAGIHEISAYIINAKEEKSAVMALIENVQREDLHFFEEAMAIERLMKDHHLTQEKISSSLGKNQSTIANKLRLLKLGREAMDMIICYGLTERHARSLLRLDDSNLQKIVIETIHKKGLNVKRTDELIDSLLEKKQDKGKSSASKFICDNRIYINSVKALYNSIKEKGVNTDFAVQEEDERLVVSIIINK